jgi:hypothetical protein
VTELEDDRSIRELLAGYGYTADTCRDDDYLALYTEDGVMNLSTGNDYTAQCVTMRTDHPDAMAFAGSPQADEKMASDCQRQDFKGVWTLYQPNDTELKSALSSFAVGYDLQLPYFAQIPATQEFRQAMSTYAAGTPIQIDSLRIWGAFDVFKAAVEAENGQPVTSATVKAGMYTLRNCTDGGIVPPLRYTQGKPTSVNCFVVWEIKNGIFVLPNGTRYSCDGGS